MSRFTEPTVLLAAMQNGDHIQIGKALPHAAAYTAWERQDADLRKPHGLGTRMHAIQGQPVRFYRLRQEGAVDCRPVAQVRGGGLNANGVRRTGFVGLKRGR